MKKILFFLFVALNFSVRLTAQKVTVAVNFVTNVDDDKNNIFYHPGQLLSWAEFKGNPVASSDAAALTSAGFGLKESFRRNVDMAELIINVNCSFSKKDSWVKPGCTTKYILSHEQKHFDIAYIHACLFVQRLKNARYTRDDYNAVIQKIYNETATDMLEMQDRYDTESGNSRIADKQAEWNDKISSLINDHY